MSRRAGRIAIVLLVGLVIFVSSLGVTLLIVARTNDATPGAVLAFVAHEASRIGKSPRPAPEPAIAPVARWRQDLAYLAAELPRLHVDAFHTASRQELEDAVADLDARIPLLTDAEITVELMRIVALIGDGHTGTWTWTERFQRYPLAFRWLDGGLWVVATDGAHADLLGLRVVRVGNAAVDAALERVRDVLSFDSEGDFLMRAQGALAYAELLHVLDLQEFPDAGRYTLADRSGTETEVEVSPVPAGAAVAWHRAGPAPLYRERAGEDHWTTVLPGGVVYLKYNNCRDPVGFRRVAKDALGALDAYRDSALIVDVRGNGGGDERVIRPLLEGIEARGLGRDGRLWVLTDAGTFSSATGNVASLRELGARSAGEPTGDGVDGYGEVERLTLANSGIVVSYATRYWRRVGSEAPLEPDLRVAPRIEDVTAGRDPVLEAVLAEISAGG